MNEYVKDELVVDEDSTPNCSSFPLLRIDQLHLYDTTFLIQTEETLSSSIENHNNYPVHEDEALLFYSRKLVDAIINELAFRRIELLLSNNQVLDDKRNTSLKNNNEIADRGDNNIQIQQTSPNNTSSNNDYETLPIDKPIKKSSDTHMQVAKKSLATMKPSINESRQIDDALIVSKPYNHGGFLSRSRKMSRTIQDRKMKTSENYKRKIFMSDKKKRRNLALERMKERKKKNNELCRIREENKRKRREQKRNQIRKEHDAIRLEMQKAADDAKVLTVEGGGTEEAGNIAAAIAASLILSKAAVDISDSDSGSSLGSNVDDIQDISDCVETESVDVENISNPLEVEGIIEEPSDYNISFQSHNESKSPDKGEDGDDFHMNSHITPSSKSEKHFLYIDFPTDEVNMSTDASNEATKLAVDYASIQNDETESSHNRKERTRSQDEIHKMNCQSPKSCNQIDVKVNKYKDIFPSFLNLFTAFSKHRANKKYDFASARECLTYQIKMNEALSQISVDNHDLGLEHDIDIPLQELLYNNMDIRGNTEDLAGFQKCNLFKVNSLRPEVTTIISDVMSFGIDEMRWKDISHYLGVGNSWNLLWTWKKTKINPEHLLVCQKISRFQNASFLTRKDLLKKQLMKYHLLFSSQDSSIFNFNIMPLTYVLPGEYNNFIQEFLSAQQLEQEGAETNLWIMKPIGMSRGRGISIVNDIGKVSYSTPTVIQKYVANPLLFRGYKFDLRLYVVVLSFQPLEAFLYKEGFARFGSRKFSLDSESIADLQIHLTNSSIQKSYWDEIDPSHPVCVAGSDGGGSKVRMTWLFKKLEETYKIDTHLLWRKICELCLKTLIAVNSEIPHQPNSFELYGFDVMIDNSLNSWLIEVNACPSLARETDLDYIVKQNLIKDTISLINPVPFDRNCLAKICKKRLSQINDFGSCMNDRDQLETDLRDIFMNKSPHQYGESIDVEQFERLAPGNILFDRIMKQLYRIRNR